MTLDLQLSSLCFRCAAYSLFLTSYKDSDLAGNCYGRGFHEDTDVIEEGVVGGIVAPGDKGRSKFIFYIF